MKDLAENNSFLSAKDAFEKSLQNPEVRKFADFLSQKIFESASCGKTELYLFEDCLLENNLTHEIHHIDTMLSYLKKIGYQINNFNASLMLINNDPKKLAQKRQVEAETGHSIFCDDWLHITWK